MAGLGLPAIKRLSDLPAEARKGFLRELAFLNTQRVTHFAWVFLGLSLLFLAVDWIQYQRQAWTLLPAYRHLFYLHLLFAAVILAWTVSARYWVPKSADVTRPVHAWLAFGTLHFTLLWATAVSLVDQRIQGEMSAYVIGCLAISVLGVFTPLQSAALYVSSLVGFLLGILWLQGDPDVSIGHLLNGITTAVVAWTLTRIFFRVRLREYDYLLTIQRQQDELGRHAVEDFLTGLYNRRYLHTYLAQEFSRSVRHKRPLTVAIGDLDGFKAVNDFVSHEAGDHVLSDIAAMLRDLVRASDVVARYGGDEFVIVFPETPLESARVVCERVRATLEERVWEELGSDFHLTVSFGLCDEISLGNHEKMLSAADEKLHEAKLAGRNLVLA